MSERLNADLSAQLDELRDANTYKTFLTLRSPQGPVVEMEGHGEVLVLSSNNYLGLAAHPEVIQAAKDALDRYGAGTASVRFICGTFEPHLELEAELAELVGTEAALTYASCWNANEALIPSLTDENTVLISDELNHASIVDAMRLAKPARKVIFGHSDLDQLREALQACEPDQRKLVVTDGVFSMEGDLARLPELVELTREHDAILIVDDSHGTGVMGATGRGVAEHFGLLGEIDVITSTLGKALGGAAGGFVASSHEVCDLLAQRSRPQLFSNGIPPSVAASALAAVRVLRAQPELVERLHTSSRTFRERLDRGRPQSASGRGGDHPDHRRRHGLRDRAQRAAARRGRLRDRFRLPGRARGNGSRAGADVRGARARAPRPRGRSVREGRPGRGPPGRLVLPISEVASGLGLDPGEIELYGCDKAKIQLSVLERLAARPNGKLIAITGITPTKAGEGKTTTAVSLTKGSASSASAPWSACASRRWGRCSARRAAVPAGASPRSLRVRTSTCISPATYTRSPPRTISSPLPYPRT